MADFYKWCGMWIQVPCLDQGNVAHVFDAPVIRQYFEYICVHGWTRLIGILVCHRLSVSDQFQGANSKGPTSHADTRILACRSCTGIGFQVHHLQRGICKPTRSWLSQPSSRILWHGVCRPLRHAISFSKSTIRSRAISRNSRPIRAPHRPRQWWPVPFTRDRLCSCVTPYDAGWRLKTLTALSDVSVRLLRQYSTF